MAGKEASDRTSSRDDPATSPGRGDPRPDEWFDEDELAAEYLRLWETLVRRHRARFPRPERLSVEEEALHMAVHSEHRDRVLGLARLKLSVRHAAGGTGALLPAGMNVAPRD